MNKMSLKIQSKSINESFARNVIGLFALELNPSISEISDIKTAVSEAVTNSIVHAYNDKIGDIDLEAQIEANTLTVIVKDYGIGIGDLGSALQPFYTTKESEERSGMGFTIMKSFMDSVDVISALNEGTTVVMTKKINNMDDNVR